MAVVAELCYGDKIDGTIIYDGIEFRPVVKFGVKMPHYYVSECGRIVSLKYKKANEIISKSIFKIGSYIRPSLFTMMIEEDFILAHGEVFSYDYYKTKFGMYKINMHIHSAVMGTWRPVNEYPPIPMEDWINTPQSAKDFIKESVVIDHKDDNTRNNHADNLIWTNHKGNNRYRKKFFQ